MTPLSITLILCSTFMHAAWNLLARREESERLFFYRMLAIVSVIIFIPGVLSEISARSLDKEAWLCVTGSGCFCGIYLYFLARSYRSSDFTTVYPVARALPVLLVAAGDVMRGRLPTPIGWAGMVLISSGCFFAPFDSFRAFTYRSYFTKAIFWLLITALATVAYTILDKIASEIIEQGPAGAARYGCMFFLFAFASYGILLKIFHPAEKNTRSPGWKLPAVGGIFCFTSYWLVLWAFQMGQHASYVIAFRQFSIVIGILVAFSIYKEKVTPVRIISIVMITTGLFLIGFSGS